MTLELKRVVYAKAEEVTEAYTCKKCKANTERTGSGGVWTIASHDKPTGGRCKKSGSSMTD